MATKKKKRKLRKSIKRLLIVVVLTVLCTISISIIKTNSIKIVDEYFDGNNLVLVLDKSATVLIAEELTDDGNWVETDDEYKVTIPLNSEMGNLYIKNVSGNIAYRKNNISLSNVKSLDISTDVVYVALNGEHKLLYNLDHEGYIDENKLVFEVEDESIIEVKDGILYGLKLGETQVSLSYMDLKDSVKVVVTDIIDSIEEDKHKVSLYAGTYSEEENDLLDEILVSRIEEAGYQTRAGVVAAARFLSLDFKYRINYFTENGRIESHIDLYADGEGRYYHLGLYLSPSRYSNIDPDLYVGGPAYWGEELYEYSLDRYSRNGLDCSGFVSWALLQAGFDPGDLGAGIAKEWLDLTNLGENIWLEDALNNNSLKVGDLLAGGEDPIEGGHIAIVIGIKDGYYYVAEATNYNGQWGLYANKYSKEWLLDNFFWQVDMDEYYNYEDGNLDDYWY